MNKNARRAVSLSRRLAEVTPQYFRAEEWVRESWDYGHLAHSSAAHVRDMLLRRRRRLMDAIDSMPPIRGV